MLFASVCNMKTPGQLKESLGQRSQSLRFSLSIRKNATLTLSLDGRVNMTNCVDSFFSFCELDVTESAWLTDAVWSNRFCYSSAH
jgi:hypothetical protein